MVTSICVFPFSSGYFLYLGKGEKHCLCFYQCQCSDALHSWSSVLHFSLQAIKYLDQVLHSKLIHTCWGQFSRAHEQNFVHLFVFTLLNQSQIVLNYVFNCIIIILVHVSAVVSNLQTYVYMNSFMLEIFTVGMEVIQVSTSSCTCICRIRVTAFWEVISRQEHDMLCFTL